MRIQSIGTTLTFIASLASIFCSQIVSAEGFISTERTASSDCSFLKPATMLNADLNGISPTDTVYMERKFPNTLEYFNYLSVADFINGCTYYQLDPDVFITSPSSFAVTAVQMDNIPGLEVVARPAPNRRASIKTTVINHLNSREYLVDFTPNSSYEIMQPKGYKIANFNGEEGAEIHTYGRWKRTNSSDAKTHALIFQLYPNSDLKFYNVNYGDLGPEHVLFGQLDSGGEEAVYVYRPYLRHGSSWQPGVVKKINDQAGRVDTAVIPARGTIASHGYRLESAVISNGQVVVELLVRNKTTNRTETQIYRFF